MFVGINFRDEWLGSFNYVDYWVVGVVMMDVVCDVGNCWLFFGVGGELWLGVWFVFYGGSSRVCYGVDVIVMLVVGVVLLCEY